MFQVLSSTPIHSQDDILDSPMSKKLNSILTQSVFEGIEIELPPLPYSNIKVKHNDIDLRKIRRTKKALRDLNTERVRTLATYSGEQYAQINSNLNKLVGITSITKASIEQLEERLNHANKLMKKIRT
ncbi:MAG: hypothetical protein V9G25_06100 [Acidimicrobiia bacterium]